ncbi:hypothetical protein Tco_0692447 [Tanacetum coccineum]
MSSIYDLKSTLTQTALDAFCQKYHIRDSVHPELPGLNQSIRNNPDGKIGVYTWFFDFANFRIPLSRFLVDVLEYFRINLSQLSVIAAAKVSYFEILCRVHGYVPTVGLFRRFYVNSKNKGWMSFSKRSENAPVSYTMHLDSLNNWNNIFFWVDASIFPSSIPWHTKKTLVPLLDSTEGLVIPLAGVDDHGDHAGQDEAVTIVVDEEFQVAAADEPKSEKKRRRVDGASGLLEHSTLAMEVEVTSASTVPFVTSSVTPMPEREGGSNIDSISGPNLRTQHPSERFVISSNSSHHSSTNAADAEVASTVRSPVPPPPVMTVAVTNTTIAGTFSVLDLEVGAEPVIQSLFMDFDSSTMDSETLHQIYVPKQNVVNESVLDDPEVCRSLIDQLAPPGLFSQLGGMDYDQLFAEFNVGAARQTCVCVEERDVKIVNLKAQLSLKEADVAEAIRLRNQVSTIEAAEVARVSELESLKEQNLVLEKEKGALEGKLSYDELSVKAASLESLRDGFVDQVSLLETTCLGLCDQVQVMSSLRNSMRRFKINRLRIVIGLSIDKGMHTGLEAGVDHGMAKRSLADIVAYDSSLEEKYIFIVLAFHGLDCGLFSQLKSQKDSNIADIISLLRLEGPFVETPEKIKEGALSCCLSISDAMGVLVDPLSSKNLIGEASTLGVPATAAAATTLVTAVNVTSIPPISVADYGVLDAEPQNEASPSPKVVFKKEELETTPEYTAAS